LGGCARYVEGTTLTCPSAAFLGGTERVTRFEPGRPAAADNVAAEVELADLVHTCKVNDRRAISTLSFSILATRRATASTGSLDVPYFVAVADAQGNILAKNNFTARLSFPAGQASVTGLEDIEETVPLTTGLRGPMFEILIGIQLTPEELDYNLARQR
jgi:hypothetical protein